MVPEYINTLLNLLAQFTGGRGGIDHVIVNYVIAAALWGGLLIIARLRYAEATHTARERLLVIGFTFALARELFMISLAILQSFFPLDPVTFHIFFPPLEHELHNLALVVIGAAYIRYLVNDPILVRRYLWAGMSITVLSYLSTFWWWADFIQANPTSKFGQTWADWVFHINRSILAIVPAVILFLKTTGWVRNSMVIAFSFFFIDAFLKLPDMALGEVYESIFTPIARSFYLSAIPIFGYVYLREQWSEAKDAENRLQDAYAQLESEVQLRTQELKSSNNLKQTIIDNAPDSIITVDDEGIIVSANPSTERIFGYPKEALTGMPIALIMPPTSISEPDCFLKNLMADKDQSQSSVLNRTREEKGQHRKGIKIPLEITISEISSGRQRLFNGILRDLSEQKEIENLKKQFVSMVSHELRTPLTSIQGSLGLLDGGAIDEIPENAKKLIAIASNNVTRLASLVDDILDIEKLDVDGLNFEMQPQLIVPLSQKSIAATEGYAIKFGITLQLTIIAVPEKAEILIDSDRFIQIMSNLLSNAIKFSSAKGIVTVQLSITNNVLRIEVSDKGEGIPEDFQKDVFERFKQADSSATRQHSGTGLGLAITKMLAEEMGGSIGFDTEIGAGTTFFIEFPLYTKPLT